MKFRRRPSPLLLLILPSISSILVTSATETLQSNLANKERDGKPEIGMILNTKPTSKADLGTKDAPVDGRDGKPHAGPFVDTGDLKKQKYGTDDGELVPKKPGASKDTLAETITIGDVKIPEINDGVMNDPSRQQPKQGTTGTEGGVSEKDKARKAQEGQTGEKAEKKPDSPKEVPPLPVGEQDKIKDEKDTTAKKDKDAGKKNKNKDTDSKADDVSELAGLEKPNDLPDKPHDMPHPLPESANKDHLDISKPDLAPGASPTDGSEEREGLIQPMHSLLLSLTMIVFSEIGDKTFLIAALMAMKHDRLLVFSAALSALLTMTVLSAVLGHAVPTLLPKRFTNFLAALLFLIFGVKMLREGLAMSSTEGVSAEMQEVEMELEEKEHLTRQQGRRSSQISPYALEMGLGRSRSARKSRSGSRLPSPPRSPSSSPERSASPARPTVKGAIAGLTNLLSFLLSPAWVQTFVMTFLGEWGDRSQIATIAMAAGQDYWWITGGAISGHAICTGVAVIGGRAIAGKVSLKIVTLGSAIIFLIFGTIYLIEAIYLA